MARFYGRHLSLLLLPLRFLTVHAAYHGGHDSNNHTRLRLPLDDYYVGQSKYTPPAYLREFSEHLNALEIEYIEYFKQWDPVNEPPEVISACLQPGTYNGTRVVRRRDPFGGLRKYRDVFVHKVKEFLNPKAPAKPVLAKFCAATSLEINVYYQVVVSSDTNLGLVTRQMVTDQTAYLNRIYKPLGITFIEQDLNYRIVPDFANSVGNLFHPHRRRTRSGDYGDLNVWITEEIQSNKPGITWIGYAPHPDATYNSYQRTFDGVVMVLSTLPGSTGPSAHQGSNLAHEVGHWLGLRHVFDEDQEDNATCTDTNVDTIGDTKQYPAHVPELFADMQVPCGGDVAESNYNFMSYSSIKGDDGFGFTTGQKARIYSRFLGVRRGIKSMNHRDCITNPIVEKHQASREKRDTEPPLPDDVLELLREDGKTCSREPIRDVSLDPSPDPEYPEYPVPVTAERKPLPPPEELEKEPPAVGSSVCRADAPPGYRQPSIEPKYGVCSNGGTCTCPGRTVQDPPVSGAETPPKPESGSGSCPVSCNPHNNRCHVHSAQTCVYPAPLASKSPRSYCACRPGYKSAHGGDATKHWRVRSRAVENLVWVAEGIVCDVLCDSNRCEEVPFLKGDCV